MASWRGKQAFGILLIKNLTYPSHMKLNLFKNVRGKPSPIAAISSNNNTIVLFRMDETLELIDSYTLKSYLSMEFKYKALSSAFLTFSTVVCGSECGRLVFLDIKTLCVTCLDVGHRVVRIAAKTDLFGCEWSSFYYSTDSGDVYERKEMESVLVYRGSSVVTSLLVSNTGSLITGSADGKVKVLENGRIGCELNLSSKRVNMICSVMGNKYAAVCDDGSFSYFDIEMGLILQKTSVRNSPLNVCAYVADRLHFSGADSRIIAFSRNGDKFIKAYQVDTHYAEVKDIEVDNGRILTVGEDTIMSVAWPTTDRYLENKVFHKSIELGTSKAGEDFYINNRDSIDFYSFDMKRERAGDGSFEDENESSRNAEKQVADEETWDDARKTTFRLSESSAEKIGYRRQAYRHRIRICTEGKAYSSSASPEFGYFAYSNSKETKIVSLGADNGVRIEQGLGLDAANRLLFIKDLVVLQNYKHEVLLIDVITKQNIGRIGFDDHREIVYSVGEQLIFGHSKVIYSISNISKLSKLNISESIVGVCEYDRDSLFVLAMARSAEAKKKYIAYRVSPLGHDPIRIKSFESYAIVSGVFHFNGRVGFFTSNAIHIFDQDMREEKYPLGAVIYGCDGMKDGMVAVQDSWSNIRLNLPLSVFKEKFSNK